MYLTPDEDPRLTFTVAPDANGILPDRMIAAMADDGLILPAYDFVESQIFHAVANFYQRIADGIDHQSAEMTGLLTFWNEELGARD